MMPKPPCNFGRHTVLDEVFVPQPEEGPNGLGNMRGRPLRDGENVTKAPDLGKSHDVNNYSLALEGQGLPRPGRRVSCLETAGSHVGWL